MKQESDMSNERCPALQLNEGISFSIRDSSHRKSPRTTIDESKVVRFEVSPKTVLEDVDNQPQTEDAENNNDSGVERRGRMRGRRKGTRAKRSPTPFVRRTQSIASGESDSEQVTNEPDTPKAPDADIDMPLDTVTTPISNRARNRRTARFAADSEHSIVDDNSNTDEKDEKKGKGASTSRIRFGGVKFTGDDIVNNI